MACCLPLATGIVGAGVAAFGAWFAPLQPYLTAASVASLAYSFYQAYRPRPSCTRGCEIPGSLRSQRRLVWSTAVAVATLLSAPHWVNWIIYWSL
jgi:hypothetical protein